MAQSVDRGLKAAMDAVQEALNQLPHGEAKKLVDPIDRLYNEAAWLQSQRDSARLLGAEKSPE